MVTMIPKPLKDHTNPENFRPISLLATLSKIMERVVKSRLTKWLNENKIISKFQFGFSKNKQTKDQILRLFQNGISTFNRNQKLDAVFIDIEKVFDRVWHKGLLYKLDSIKIPGASLIGELSSRKCVNFFKDHKIVNFM